MVKIEICMFLTFFALILANEIEDGDQKKRGAVKATTLNAIPIGVQKPEYTYNIYQQNPASTIPSQNYPSQVSSSFYPNQESSTYYNPANSVDTTPTYASQSQATYTTQPVQSQFIPINFIPSPGYQSKYQIIPTKSNIQLAILPQPQYQSPSIAPYSPGIFSPTPSTQITPPNINLLNSFGSPGYNLPPNFQPYSLGNLHQPSTMILLRQSNPSLYNNLVYPNPSQSFYNYYPTQSQAKYSYSSGGSVGTEYEKAQTVAQNIPKADNDVSIQNSEYITPSDSNSGYKSTYSRRSTYNKFK